jgi:methyl-accepting chemotaxis protein
MTDISSVTSSATTFIAKQVADLNKAASEVNTSFANTLSKVQSSVGLGPKTGFTPVVPYAERTLAGRTKAAFNNTLNATKSALHIKP